MIIKRAIGVIVIGIVITFQATAIKPTRTYSYTPEELDYINNLRNRIAHNEPICFGNPVSIDTSYAKNRYSRIMTLFEWMDIEGASLLYGLGHISNACDQIDKLLQ